MGVSLNFYSYKKDEKYIHSENSILGIYQVDDDLKQAFLVNEPAISFRWGLHSLAEIERNFNGYSVYEGFSMFLFYYFARGINNEFTKSENDKFYSLLFEPKPILTAIDRLLQLIDILESPSIKDYNEKENLILLKQLLERSVSENRLIECSNG
ncbi:MAG: hypothetical protein K0S33_161 [Bacteroidetes bacterium]|jgi:hypothetical protein|nr:hypothetical protein [Bacteroidota bacterium]